MKALNPILHPDPTDHEMDQLVSELAEENYQLRLEVHRLSAQLEEVEARAATFEAEGSMLYRLCNNETVH